MGMLPQQSDGQFPEQFLVSHLLRDTGVPDHSISATANSVQKKNHIGQMPQGTWSDDRTLKNLDYWYPAMISPLVDIHLPCHPHIISRQVEEPSEEETSSSGK